MASAPGAVLVLVCPTCGKKYRGNPEKPDGRYQCPDDQATLTKFSPPDPFAPSAVKQPEPPPPPPPDFSISGHDQPETSETQRDFVATTRIDAPSPGYMGGRDPLLASAHDDLAPDEIARRAADALHNQGTKSAALGNDQTVFAGSETLDAPSTVPTPLPTPTPYAGIPTPPPMPVRDSATVVAGSRTYSAQEVPTGYAAAATKMSQTPTQVETPMLTEEGTFTGFQDRRSVVSVMEGTLRPDASESSLEASKYETVGKLGQGGGGQVLKVLDRDLRREVAMKMLLPQHREGGGIPEDVLLRFIKEAQATGQLEHPNIVPVHDLGVDGEGHIYFTLKYAQGDSLKDVIRGRRDDLFNDERRKFRDLFSPMQMVEVLIGICQGVAYAHSKGIIHRDLKPENVMMGRFGEVLVMDWGLAKALGKNALPMEQTESVADLSSPDGEASQTMEGSIAGTPAYMSPEQAAGKISELNERTDIYSLGAMLYEILSGHPPYKGTSALDVVKQVLTAPPPSLSSGTYGFRPIPRELKSICEKAMERDPGMRYASVQAMRDDLQNYLLQRPVSACPDTPMQKAAKFYRRNKNLVATAVGSTAAVLAIGLVVWLGAHYWNVRTHIKAAEGALKMARNPQANPAKIADSNPYKQESLAQAQFVVAKQQRANISLAINELLKALDASPGNKRARLLMAESYMELWRLALAEKNPELMRANRAELERYSPPPSPFSDELNGFGTVEVAVEPADAEIYLYTFETLRATDKQGNALPPRLIPVPFDLEMQKPDDRFMLLERNRAATEENVLPGTHSIFRLEQITASRAGTGNVSLSGLPPGSYMLLLFARGRETTRVPFNLDRRGKTTLRVEMPRPEAIPAGFFYIAGGDAIVGGEGANSVPRRVHHLAPFLMYHDEINIGDYGDFLHDLTKTGHGAEAKTRLPRDFGKPLATLSAAGELLPADSSADPVKFQKTAVRGISYNDAIAYVAWRSQRDHLVYRLPKEWEWESSCRGADGRKYSWGDSPAKNLAIILQGYGDSGSNISWKWEDYKDESPWGIHNLAGGVAEWTQSVYDPNAKPTDPVYGQYAIRGNAWSLPPTGLECSFRTSGQPDYFHPTIGFRLAADYPIKATDGYDSAAAVRALNEAAAEHIP
jgi:eukaryotic-like serine/threonine-protein kinase